MNATLGDWLALLFLVTIIYVLVRPGSKAAELVDAVGSMMVAMIKRATDIAASNGG